MYNFQDSNGLNSMFITWLKKDTLPQILWNLTKDIIYSCLIYTHGLIK